MKPPFIHFEDLTQKGEDELGNEPYVFVLPTDYQTNEGVKSILRNNIQNMADVMNGFVQPNPALYPYIRYEEFAPSPLRKNAWVFISKKLILTPNRIIEVRAFMNDVVSIFPPYKPDTIQDHPLCDTKIKWESPTIQPA